MYWVGKLDKRLYSCISDDIATDEVIITDNQIEHIKVRHPEAYEKVIEVLQEAIKAPDYIIKDKHKDSGLVIKRVLRQGKYIQVVLRICTSKDLPEYRNSIISSWEISERRLQNYLRNKQILYKKE